MNPVGHPSKSERLKTLLRNLAKFLRRVFTFKEDPPKPDTSPSLLTYQHNGFKFLVASKDDLVLVWYLSLGNYVPPGYQDPLEVYEGRVRHPIEGPFFIVLVLSAIERQTGTEPLELLDYVDSEGNLLSLSYSEFCDRVVDYMERNKLLLKI